MIDQYNIVGKLQKHLNGEVITLLSVKRESFRKMSSMEVKTFLVQRCRDVACPLGEKLKSVVPRTLHKHL